MIYLLDTHTVLWFFDHVEKLSETALNAVLDPESKKYVSIVSVWELAIKISLGKAKFDGGIDNFLHAIGENGFELFPIEEEHIRQVEILPFLHRDPFDRMLVAAAMTEDLSLVTADVNIHQYNISWVW